MAQRNPYKLVIQLQAYKPAREFLLEQHNAQGWVTGFTTAILETASVSAYSPSSLGHPNTDPLSDLHQEERTSEKQRSGSQYGVSAHSQRTKACQEQNR
jgi:hypothetical protein